MSLLHRALCALISSATLLSAQPSSTPAWTATLDSVARAALLRTGTPGVQFAIVLDGRIVHERALGLADAESQRPATTRTLFRIGSVTKMLTAATLMELAAAGKLDPQVPIGRYVPDVASRRVGTVTTHQLLTHTAGWLDNAVAYGRMGEGALGEVFREVTDTLFFTDPGQVISYSNPGFSMAGYVAERVGEARFATLAERLVLRPVGMARSTFRPLEVMTADFAQGHMGGPGSAPAMVRPYTENTAQWAAGFLFSTAGELARFSMALMQNGELDGKRVLAPTTVQRLTTGYQPIPGDSIARYGYGLVIGRKDGVRVWEHGGAINGFDAIVTMWPDRRAALIMLDNRSGSPLTEIDRFVREEVMRLPARPMPAVLTPRVGTADEQRAVVGTYAMGETRVSITSGGDTLRFMQGPVTLPLLLLGTERIRVLPPMGDPIDLLVVRDGSGRVRYLHQGLRALARQP